MATTTHVSVEEYLRTSYRPDMEYIDGEKSELLYFSHGISYLFFSSMFQIV